jgi:uncharacterized protein (DUF433 family)
MVHSTGEYIERRGDGYYVSGSRISLDSMVYAFRRGEAPETILAHFPSIGSLGKVYGAIAFALDHAEELDEYLNGQERKWEEDRRRNPPEAVAKLRVEKERRAIPSP